MLDTSWWVIALAVIGVVAVLNVLIELFFRTGARSDELTSTSAPEVGSPPFVSAIAGNVNAPVMEGGSAELLNNGDEVFPAMLQAVREARCTVNWMTYIFKEGEAADMVLEALTERARAGVEVRLLLDGLGGKDAPDEGVEKLKAAGGHVAYFRPPRFGKLTRLHKRNHRRAIIIDGETGFTGGVAVSDEWLGNAEDPDHWRDSMIRLTGCAATNLQSAFAQLWSETTGEVLIGDEFYPQDPRSNGSDEMTRHLHIVSSPSDENNVLREPFWLSMRCARERIWITTPYFVPDPAIRAVLCERAQAGIDVRALVPNEHIDIPLVRWAAQHYYGELLEAGVRIWEYQPTMLHAKLLVVDGAWSIVGSANMDVRSGELNEEVIFGILDRSFGRQLEQTFLRDLESAQEIRLDEWCRRGLFPRLRSRTCKILEEQY